MKQLSLFQDAEGHTMHVAGFMTAIKAAMFNAARESPLSRAQIAARMNQMAQDAGVRLTKGRSRAISQDTLDKWLSVDDREHPPSLLALHVFCLALRDHAPLHVLLAGHGCQIMSKEDSKMAAYGRACIKGKAQARAKRRLEEELLEMETKS